MSNEVKLVRVELDRHEGAYHFATSPDLRGLLVMRSSRDEVLREVPRAIARLLPEPPALVARCASEREDEQRVMLYAIIPARVMEAWRHDSSEEKFDPWKAALWRTLRRCR